MSEPYTPPRYQCARCSESMSRCRCEHPAPVRALLASYVELRRECMALEELISTGAFGAEELTRLDKGVTVMKVGFKLVKKVLRARGLMGRLKPIGTGDQEFRKCAIDTPAAPVSPLALQPNEKDTRS